MSEKNFIKEVPSNIEELKRRANNKRDWRDRLGAIKELKAYDCKQSRDILTRLAISDPVFKVKENALWATQALGITKNGKPIKLDKKQKGNLVKDINKQLVRVRDSFGEEYSIDEFKIKFKDMYPETYDTYEGDKGKKLDGWLINVISSLPKK